MTMLFERPAARDVILRDGRTLRLRAPDGEDRPAILAFFEAMSARSRYLRFHGFPALDDRLADRFVDVDWNETGCVVGELEGRIVACASWARLREPRTAEVAFAVADEMQGLGVGTRLLEQLAALAGEAGIEHFVAEVMSENRAMLSVFADAGFATARELAGGEIEVRFDITPTEHYQARVDERDHVAVRASLQPFFRPRTVAVVGASRRRKTIGGELFRNVLRAEFTGAAYPVNVGAKPVAGVPAYETVADIPEPIDLAVICVPGAAVIDASRSALEAGVRALCVISAGFAETGAEGVARQEELLAMVRAHGARLIGPNTLGIALSSVNLNATFAPRAFLPGRIGFSSQSGALGLALLEAASARGLGLSSFVSIGNKADVSSNDLIEWWEDDEETDLVLLYLESFGNPRKFARLARRVARNKPVLALKSGTTSSGQKAASSHTAALAGSEAAVDALFRQAGVLRLRTLEELLDAATLLSSQPPLLGNNVGVVTNAGGLGILCADACESAGLELPSLSPATERALREVLPVEASVGNPVDMLGSATGREYEAVLPVLLADPRLDALIVLFVPPVQAGPEEVAEAILRAIPEQRDKPVLVSVISGEGTPESLIGSGLATFPFPESAARALGHAAERAEWLRRPVGKTPELEGLDRASAQEAAAGAERWLTPAETRRVLAAYGVPLVPERVVETADEAVAAAAEFGYPVVVKSAAAGAHKTETGGIALNLQDEEAVRGAVARIGAPVLVQRMISGGVELLAGVVQDPVFGPLVAFGPGGVFAELIGDASFRLAPLTDVDANELVSTGKAGRLVAGWRGSPPADRAALVDLLHRLSRLGDDLPELAELDLNPVLAGPDGCVAVDARIRVRPPAPATTAKTW